MQGNYWQHDAFDGIEHGELSITSNAAGGDRLRAMSTTGCRGGGSLAYGGSGLL